MRVYAIVPAILVFAAAFGQGSASLAAEWIGTCLPVIFPICVPGLLLDGGLRG